MPIVDYHLYSVYAAHLGGVSLLDVSSASFRSASRKSVVVPGGDLHPRAIVQCCADPMVSFGTRDLRNALNAMSLQGGLYLSTYESPPTDPLLLQLQQRERGAAFIDVGQSHHILGVAAKSFSLISGLSSRQDDDGGASVSIDCRLLSHGGYIDPMLFDELSPITGTPTFQGIWYHGPVWCGPLDGSPSPVQGVTGVSINPGINFRAPRVDGFVYSTSGTIVAITPEIRISTLNPRGLSSMLGYPFGSALTNPSTALHFYFQQGVHGASRFAPDQAEHIRVTVVTGDMTTDSMSVNSINDVETEIVLRPTGGITAYIDQEIPWD